MRIGFDLQIDFLGFLGLEGYLQVSALIFGFWFEPCLV